MVSVTEKPLVSEIFRLNKNRVEYVVQVVHLSSTPMLMILGCAQTFCYILDPAGHAAGPCGCQQQQGPIHSSSYLLHGVLQMKWNLLLLLQTQPEIKSTQEENSSPSLVAKWKKIINDFLLLNLMPPAGGGVQNIPYCLDGWRWQ